MEDESEGKAEDRFSWIALLEEVKENPEEAGIANVSLTWVCEDTERKGVLDCACTTPVVW